MCTDRDTNKKIVIAIDGFSSCGKSTFAKAIARRLGYIFIDTGAMYRAVTLYALEHGAIRSGMVDEETVVRMRRALERLRPDERVLVALFYEEERSLAEIAQIMNLTLSNVKVRLHRLRGRLRHYMEE